jgi:hypothetical protein
MAIWRKTYVSKKTGEVRHYEYACYGYYVPAELRALKALKKRPLRRVLNKSGGGWKWTAGQRGPVFHDATVVKLIVKGQARCLGDFIELASAPRRNTGEINASDQAGRA